VSRVRRFDAPFGETSATATVPTAGTGVSMVMLLVVVTAGGPSVGSWVTGAGSTVPTTASPAGSYGTAGAAGAGGAFRSSISRLSVRLNSEESFRRGATEVTHDPSDLPGNLRQLPRPEHNQCQDQDHHQLHRTHTEEVHDQLPLRADGLRAEPGPTPIIPNNVWQDIQE